MASVTPRRVSLSRRGTNWMVVNPNDPSKWWADEDPVKAAMVFAWMQELLREADNG